MDYSVPPSETQSDYLNRILDSIDVKVPQKCPKCGVELEENLNQFYQFVWSCIVCGFSKKNKDSFYTESRRAKKIYKRDLEGEIKTQGKS
jgi:ribosomal protein L37AE/L43A